MDPRDNVRLLGHFTLASMLFLTRRRYSSEHKNLYLVARDVKPLEVYSAEFLVDNSTLTFLVSDALQNLVIFMYQPEAKESAGGQRLVRKADINIGSHVTAFWRIRFVGAGGGEVLVRGE